MSVAGTEVGAAGYEEISGEGSDTVKLHNVVGNAFGAVHTDPGQRFAHGLPVVLVGVERHLHDLESAAVVLGIKLAQEDVTLLTLRQGVGGEVEEHHVVLELGEAALMSAYVGEAKVNDAGLAHLFAINL